jgi:hypothetical protein
MQTCLASSIEARSNIAPIRSEVQITSNRAETLPIAEAELMYGEASAVKWIFSQEKSTLHADRYTAKILLLL